MKVAVLCQEEPVFLGPFLRDVIELRPDQVSAVVVAGGRSAGEARGRMSARWDALRTFWMIFEPRAFLGALGRRLRFAVLGPGDPNSVEGTARRHGIPVVRTEARRSAELVPVVERLEADLVLNQSEILLTDRLLRLPRVGFVNRHASLLPSHRGRLASFWAHAATPPSYGVTIHMVDEGIDTGDILLQWRATGVDPRWPFPRVLRHLNRKAPALFWAAVDGLARGDPPTPQPEGDGTPAHRFPTVAEARRYRAVLRARRAGA